RPRVEFGGLSFLLLWYNYPRRRLHLPLNSSFRFLLLSHSLLNFGLPLLLPYDGIHLLLAFNLSLRLTLLFFCHLRSLSGRLLLPLNHHVLFGRSALLTLLHLYLRLRLIRPGHLLLPFQPPLSFAFLPSHLFILHRWRRLVRIVHFGHHLTRWI